MKISHINLPDRPPRMGKTKFLKLTSKQAMMREYVRMHLEMEAHALECENVLFDWTDKMILNVLKGKK